MLYRQDYSTVLIYGKVPQKNKLVLNLLLLLIFANLMEHQYTIADLSPHLFWDVDKSSIDFDDKFLIIHRVLEYGLLKDWILINQVYGANKIKEIATQLRSLDDVTLSFLCTIYHIEKKDFRCYNFRQSTQSYWNY